MSPLLLPTPKVVYRGTVTGLRISAVDGTAFIDNVSITSELQNAKLLSSGSVTAANLKLSAVDGVAFVDFSAADVLTNNIGKYIVIKDSTGKEIKGWIKAAGTSETLSATELITNGDFETGGTPPSGWTNYGSNTCVQSADPHVGSYCGLWTYNSSISMGGNPFTAVVGSLYKTSGYLKNVNATGAIVGALNSQVNNSPITDTVAYHLVELYGTAIVTNPHCQIKVANGSAIGQQIKVDGISVKQVLTPSSTGVTIVSSKGGTTYNWESKDASFAYNSAITYSIYDRDLTAYADGNHQIEIYDADNRMLRGVLKAAGTSEGLGDETVSGFTNISYDVFTTDGANITNAEQTTAGIKICFQNYSYQSLALYKSVVSLSLVSGAVPLFGIGVANTLGGAAGNAKQLSNGVNTNYHTPIFSGACGFYNVSNSKWNTSGISLKQVTAPSSSGATIVSAKGGETYNFSYKDPSFTYNSSSYYCIIKTIR